MKAKLEVDTGGMERLLRASVEQAGIGAKKAVQQAVDEIYDQSQMEVPVMTGTLKSSGYKEVEQRGFVTRGRVGYGGNGDPINPISETHSSEYMVVVHEDLSAFHPNGKAKYLEDPVNRVKATFAKKGGSVFRQLFQKLFGR